MATMGSLFAGIGGFDLGVQRAGFDIAWQVEINPWCRKILAKHWPDVPRYKDVREVGTHNLKAVDVLCGGFPCQDISDAGRRAGLTGERSGLWFEYGRIISEIRPRYAIVENVPGLFVRGIDQVLGSLAEIGYDAEWHVISAKDMGAPHLRKRVWIIAYAMGDSDSEHLHRCVDGGREKRGRSAPPPRPLHVGDSSSHNMAHPTSSRRNVSGGTSQTICRPETLERLARCGGAPWRSWQSEPDVGRVAYGVPARVDRLRGLGNAIVPHIAEYIAHCILEYDYGVQSTDNTDHKNRG